MSRRKCVCEWGMMSKVLSMMCMTCSWQELWWHRLVACTREQRWRRHGLRQVGTCNRRMRKGTRRTRCGSGKEAGARRAMGVEQGRRRVGGIVIMCSSCARRKGSLHSRTCAVGHGIGFWAQCSDYPYIRSSKHVIYWLIDSLHWMWMCSSTASAS